MGIVDQKEAVAIKKVHWSTVISYSIENNHVNNYLQVKNVNGRSKKILGAQVASIVQEFDDRRDEITHKKEKMCVNFDIWKWPKRKKTLNNIIHGAMVETIIEEDDVVKQHGNIIRYGLLRNDHNKVRVIDFSCITTSRADCWEFKNPKLGECIVGSSYKEALCFS